MDVCERSFQRSAKPLRALADSTQIAEWQRPGGGVWSRLLRGTCCYFIQFPELADFQFFHDGAQVLAHAQASITDDTLEHLYLNQVLPLALSLQGKLVFHAAAVAIDDGAAAFMGVSGRGKSTLLASFAQQGFALLADDGLELERRADAYMVAPRHQSMRLWDDSRSAIFSEPVSLAPPVQYTAKSRLLAGPGLAFCEESRALRSVFILGDGSARDLTVASMSASEALIALVNHSFLVDIEARDRIAVHFDEVARLSTSIRFFRIDYPRRYDILARVREAVLDAWRERECCDEAV